MANPSLSVARGPVVAASRTASAPTRLRVYAMLALGIVCIALSAIFTHWSGTPGAVSAFYRVAIAAVVLTPLMARGVATGRVSLDRRVWALAAVAGIFFASDLALWGTALFVVPVATATLLANNAPIFVGLGALLARRYAGSGQLVGPLTMQLAALVYTLPLVLITGVPTRVPSPTAIAMMAILGVMGTAVAYLLYFSLIRNVGASRTTVVTYLLPCTALIWGVTLQHETVSWNTLAGLLLILLGTMVTNDTLRGLRRSSAAREALPLPAERAEAARG